MSLFPARSLKKATLAPSGEKTAPRSPRPQVAAVRRDTSRLSGLSRWRLAAERADRAPYWLSPLREKTISFPSGDQDGSKFRTGASVFVRRMSVGAPGLATLMLRSTA